MNRSVFKTTLLLAIFVASLSSHATTYSTERIACPVGGEIFTTEVMMSYSIFGRRLDLKPHGSHGVGPRPLVLCPNGFVDYKNNYSQEELIKLTELVNSEDYQRLRSGNNEYFLLAKILQHMGADKLTTAWHYLNASWMAENNYNRSQYVRYLNLSINDMIEAKSEGEVGFTPRFLIAELNRLKGDFEAAMTHLKDLEANWSAKDYELVLIEFERGLINDKNSNPMSQPEG